MTTTTNSNLSVYTNMHGDIVIRQRNSLGEENAVVLPKERLDALILALQAQCGAEADAHDV
jgi:hypothetical protein